MNKLVFVGLVACSGTLCRGAEPSSALPRSTPEAQGISSSAILAFVEAADKEIDSLHSLMLVRHGHVVAEGWWSPYAAGSPHELYSLSKSFTSTAVGLAISEGKLSLDDPVLKFFPEDAPEHPSEKLRSMRIHDLLRMSTGHQTEPSVRSAPNWARAFLAHPVPHKPGTHFLYNTSATYMLSAIVQKATGSTVLDYLRPRLFDPLGIKDPTWGTSPQGVSLGGYGLNVRTEDIARFGQLYLQKGKWNGKQVVPAAWVDAATARQTSNGSNPASDWEQGYGYQFWRCRHGAFRGDGAFGQYCLVLPDQDAVIAITSGTGNMQAVLNLIWDRLLPAMKQAPLSANDEARAKLERALERLGIPLPAAYATNEAAVRVSGRTYRFPKNDRKLETLTLEYAEHGQDVTMFLRSDGVDHRIVCGRGEWRKGRFGHGGLKEQPAAAGGAWTKEDTYTARVCLYETPFLLTFEMRFEGDKVHLDSRMNVGFGPTHPPQLVGEAEKPPQDRAREASGGSR